MKVGIVSTPLYANYGGVLQNYAFQQVLKKMGHEPITLDYMPSLPFWRYCLYAGKTAVCALVPSKRHPLKPYHHFLQRPEAFKQFVDKNIVHTHTVASYSAKLLKQYGVGAIAVGSDQVWRYKYSNEVIEDMFLGFAKGVNCKKFAYAASFGVEHWDYPESITPCIKELIKQFDAVSVRESSGVSICHDTLGTEATVVLDPTLLLTEEDYLSLCTPAIQGEEPYLASYVLDADERKQQMIETFAKEKGLAIRNMTVSDNGCSIEEWLSTIRNAEYVVTDSFHGSVFSIIFGKQFSTFINKGRGADRFYTLFEALGLTSRLMDDNAESLLTGDTIEYDIVNQKLDSQREKSIGFLKEAFK